MVSLLNLTATCLLPMSKTPLRSLPCDAYILGREACTINRICHMSYSQDCNCARTFFTPTEIQQSIFTTSKVKKKVGNEGISECTLNPEHYSRSPGA
jgi:hypothetical protein